MPSGLDKTLKNELCGSQDANSQTQMESDSRIDRARKGMRCSIFSKEFIYRDSAHTDLKATFARIRKERRAQQIEAQVVPIKALQDKSK